MLIKLELYYFYADHSIFDTDQAINNFIITTFIDNLINFAPCGSGIIFFIKLELITNFKMVDMGLLIFYVRLKDIWDWEK